MYRVQIGEDDYRIIYERGDRVMVSIDGVLTPATIIHDSSQDKMEARTDPAKGEEFGERLYLQSSSIVQQATTPGLGRIEYLEIF